jgi:site-specific DNA-methyltransferase (adenine-specific)
MREYGGHTFDFEAVADALFRITMPGGVVAWVVQDQIENGSETSTSFKQALYFKTVGFNLHSTMIMISNGGKLPHRIRYAPVHHYAFILSKGRPRSINLIRDRRNKNAGQEYRWHVRRPDGHTVKKKDSPQITPPFGERNNVWHYDVGFNQTTKDKKAFDHPALMSEMMAEDHIISWSRPGDLVFDPFSGAGTTCKMALLNDRRYLGMEIHEPYYDLSIERLESAREEHKQRLDEFF